MSKQTIVQKIEEQHPLPKDALDSRNLAVWGTRWEAAQEVIKALQKNNQELSKQLIERGPAPVDEIAREKNRLLIEELSESVSCYGLELQDREMSVSLITALLVNFQSQMMYDIKQRIILDAEIEDENRHE